MRRALILGVSAMVFAGTISCGDGGDATPAADRRTGVDRPTFSGPNAYAHVEAQVAFGPRVPGAEGHAAQLAWMIEYLTERADTVLLEEFQHDTKAGQTLSLTNVMARFQPGEKRRLLLLTHWDTRPTADQSPDPARQAEPVMGANDGASGTAILLELADMLAGQESPGGVDLLFVDGEDYGPGTEDMFLGARRYANNVGDDRPVYGVLLDMVGDRDPAFPVEANSAELAPQVVQRVWGLARDMGYGRYFPTRAGQRVSDDHLFLNEVGIPTVDIIDFDYGPQNRLWHTTDDTVDEISPQTLRMVGELIAELVYQGG